MPRGRFGIKIADLPESTRILLYQTKADHELAKEKRRDWIAAEGARALKMQRLRLLGVPHRLIGEALGIPKASVQSSLDRFERR